MQLKTQELQVLTVLLEVVTVLLKSIDLFSANFSYFSHGQYKCLLMDWKQPHKLYVTVKQSLLLHLQMNKNQYNFTSSFD